MSQQATEPVIESTEPVAEPVNNPPYYEQLMSLPEDVRPLVEPHFKKWDADTTQRFQALHSQTEPWKEVIESHDPGYVSQALQLAQLLDENPEALFDYMKDFFKFGSEQGPSASQPNGQIALENEDEPEIWSDPRFSELESAVKQMATIIVNEQNQAQATQQQQMLDEVLGQLKTEHGDFDENFVLTQIVNGADPTQAIAAWQGVVAKAAELGGGNTAPVVAPANGGTSPSVLDGSKRPGELTTKETTDIVVQMLEQAANASR